MEENKEQEKGGGLSQERETDVRVWREGRTGEWEVERWEERDGKMKRKGKKKKIKGRKKD